MDNHKLDTDTQVFFYEQEFYVLSNFSAFRLTYRNVSFDTSEHAYQWSKFQGYQWALADLIHMAPSAHEAFRLAQANRKFQNPRFQGMKLEVMKEILFAKAQQHEYVRRKLLQTGDRELIEDSWRDDFWGWGPEKNGRNMLGQLWMEVRQQLRTHSV